MHLTFFASALRLGLIHTAASVCLFFSGSAIRRLTGGEWGPCIGAARSVARVTSRAETCVFVSVLYFTSFVLHDGFPGSVRIRRRKCLLNFSWPALQETRRLHSTNSHVVRHQSRVSALIFNQLTLMLHHLKWRPCWRRRFSTCAALICAFSRQE